MFTVCGIDPGLAMMGVVVAEIGGPGFIEVSAAKLIITESQRKKNVSFSSDCIRRAREIATALQTIVTSAQIPKAFFIEGVSLPRNASAVFQIGLSFGAVSSLAERCGVPIIASTPQAIKAAMTGMKGAPKKDMVDALSKVMDVSKAKRMNGTTVPRGKLDHIADAYGAIMAGLSTEIGRVLISAMGK